MSKYKCYGSTDPQIVEQAFEHFSESWRNTDLNEFNSLQEARAKLGTVQSTSALAQRMRSIWPAVPSEHNSNSHEQNRSELLYCELLPIEVLPFLRSVEQIVSDLQIAHKVVYSASGGSAALILPTGSGYRELMRDASRISIFSSDYGPPDEWCFLVESPAICAIVFARKTTGI